MHGNPARHDRARRPYAALLAGLLGVVAACAGQRGSSPEQGGSHALMSPAELQALPVLPPDRVFAYGDDPNQHGELRVPAGPGPHPVAILLHGGCWKAQYATLRDLAPMGDALRAEGVATWNIEYRRLHQLGSGWPGTYLDVGRAVDHLRSIAPAYRLDLSRVVVVGHSAGGHLAMWVAARNRLRSDSGLFVAQPLPLRGVINLAGTIDMADNIAVHEAACRDAVVTSMMGGTRVEVPQRYADSSASSMVPLGIPQVLIWGEHEEFVPLPVVHKYVRAARQAGDAVQLIIVPAAGHFETASPFSPAWPTVRSAIAALLHGRLPD